MTLKVVWGISGSGDKMPETVAAMAAVRERLDVEITAAVSIAGVRVLRWYKLSETVEEIAKSVKIEKDANSPFITGPLQIGQYDCLLVAPATANSVAKIAHGIEDTMLTNAVGQTAKSTTPIYIMPVDLRPGTTVTMRPGGERLELKIRAIDVENTDKLRTMEGITVFESPSEIEGILRACAEAAGRRLVKVSVSTGCRLHLGFTNLSDDVGRCYGSLGVALDRPSTTVVVEECSDAAVVGDDPEQIRSCLRRFCDHYQVDPHVSVGGQREHAPAHRPRLRHAARARHRSWSGSGLRHRRGRLGGRRGHGEGAPVRSGNGGVPGRRLRHRRRPQKRLHGSRGGADGRVAP